MLRRLAARLPSHLQLELKRLQHLRQLRAGTFVSPEPEFRELSAFVSPGDWVLDIGANVGHYAARLSSLVGKDGRVIAFEPVVDTFAILAALMSRVENRNVTTLNVAASDSTSLLGFAIPDFDDGLSNFYQAHVEEGATGNRVLTLAVDSLALPARVSLAKIDVEGHEFAVLKGMRKLLERDRPTLIVEGVSEEVLALLKPLGYRQSHREGSPNSVFRNDRSQ